MECGRRPHRRGSRPPSAISNSPSWLDSVGEGPRSWPNSSLSRRSWGRPRGRSSRAAVAGAETVDCVGKELLADAGLARRTGLSDAPRWHPLEERPHPVALRHDRGIGQLFITGGSCPRDTAIVTRSAAWAEADLHEQVDDGLRGLGDGAADGRRQADPGVDALRSTPTSVTLSGLAGRLEQESVSRRSSEWRKVGPSGTSRSLPRARTPTRPDSPRFSRHPRERRAGSREKNHQVEAGRAGVGQERRRGSPIRRGARRRPGPKASSPRRGFRGR